MTNTPTLLPCPFCGSDDVKQYRRHNHKEVGCGNCGSVAHVDRWNERRPSIRPDGEMAEQVAQAFGYESFAKLKETAADVPDGFAAMFLEMHPKIMALTAAIQVQAQGVPEGLIERISRYDPKKIAPAALREDILELSSFIAWAPEPTPPTAQEG